MTKRSLCTSWTNPNKVHKLCTLIPQWLSTAFINEQQRPYLNFSDEFKPW